MKTAVILAAGRGKKIWPYAEVRPKVLIPVANKPVICYLVDKLLDLGLKNIIIAADYLSERLINEFRHNRAVQVIKVGNTGGPVFSLTTVKDYIPDEDFLVLYGDTVVGKSDLKSLIEMYHAENVPVLALVSPLGKEPGNDWICCALNKGYLTNICGHPRSGCTHRFCGYAMNKSLLTLLEKNSGIFTSVEVGMMPPHEGYIEMSLADYRADGYYIPVLEAKKPFFDLDKPWHILQANEYLVETICNSLHENVLDRGAKIDPTAMIQGYIKLGKESRIGRNVIINGNVSVGDRSVIENGAIIDGNAVIGNDTYIGNYCYLSNNSTVGSRCVINHCAESSGVIMDGAYLYHYMEFYGVLGENSDLGAATVCGTLRFDDGKTMHRIRGRKEYPQVYSNASYIGDYCRTGVNAIIMPGCKVGVYSIVGPGVLLQEDLPDRTIVQLRQQLVKKEWGPERYGW